MIRRKARNGLQLVPAAVEKAHNGVANGNGDKPLVANFNTKLCTLLQAEFDLCHSVQPVVNGSHSSQTRNGLQVPKSNDQSSNDESESSGENDLQKRLALARKRLQSYEPRSTESAPSTIAASAYPLQDCTSDNNSSNIQYSYPAQAPVKDTEQTQLKENSQEIPLPHSFETLERTLQGMNESFAQAFTHVSSQLTQLHQLHVNPAPVASDVEEQPSQLEKIIAELNAQLEQERRERELSEQRLRDELAAQRKSFEQQLDQQSRELVELRKQTEAILLEMVCLADDQSKSQNKPVRSAIKISSAEQTVNFHKTLIKFAQLQPKAALPLIGEVLIATGEAQDQTLEFELRTKEERFRLAIGGESPGMTAVSGKDKLEKSFVLKADALSLAQFLAGERRLRRCGRVRVRRRFKRARPLEEIVTAAVELGAMVKPGVKLDPFLLQQALSYNIDPSLGRGHCFVVAFELTDINRRWSVSVDNGRPVVTTQNDLQAAATVKVSRDSLVHTLVGQEYSAKEKAIIDGDPLVVSRLSNWFQQALVTSPLS